MKILALETSTKHFSLAVSADGKILSQKSILLKTVLSAAIIPAIQKMLKSLKLSFDDLDGYAIGLGPGSFTSLRVGLSTVKAFALASGKPVVGVPSLDALALKLRDQDCDQICTLIDARRNQVYACIYEKKGGDLKKASGYLLRTLDDVLNRVHGRTLFVGDGIGLYRDAITKAYETAAKKKKTGCTALFTEEKFWYPQAAELATIASQRFGKNDFDAADKLVPLYLYAEDCQVTNPVKAGQGATAK